MKHFRYGLNSFEYAINQDFYTFAVLN